MKSRVIKVQKVIIAIVATCVIVDFKMLHCTYHMCYTPGVLYIVESCNNQMKLPILNILWVKAKSVRNAAAEKEILEMGGTSS